MELTGLERMVSVFTGAVDKGRKERGSIRPGPIMGRDGRRQKRDGSHLPGPSEEPTAV